MVVANEAITEEFKIGEFIWDRTKIDVTSKGKIFKTVIRQMRMPEEEKQGH